MVQYPQCGCRGDHTQNRDPFASALGSFVYIWVASKTGGRLPGGTWHNPLGVQGFPASACFREGVHSRVPCVSLRATCTVSRMYPYRSDCLRYTGTGTGAASGRRLVTGSPDQRHGQDRPIHWCDE